MLTDFQGKTPWGDTGKSIPEVDQYSVKEAIEASGLDWNVSLQELVTTKRANSAVKYAAESGENVSVKPNLKNRAVINESDDSVLGVVGPTYNLLQNKDAFGWFQPFLDNKVCRFATAGSILNGRRVWVLAELNEDPSEIVKGDDVNKFILLSNSHDGGTSVKIGFTPIRIWCTNCLSLAHNASTAQILRIRHSSQLNVNMELVRGVMNTANKEFNATAEKYQFLASRHINASDLRKYIKIVLKVDNVEEEELSTRSKNTIDRIIHLCEEGKGNQLKGVKGTYWSAYNGVTEYLNHYKGRSVNNRLNNIWFGADVKTNHDALQTALTMAE